MSLWTNISRLRHFWQSVCAVALDDATELVPRERNIGRSWSAKKATKQVGGLVHKVRALANLDIDLELRYIRIGSLKAHQYETELSYTEV